MPLEPDTLPRTPPIDRNRELLKSGRQVVYKSIGGIDLSVYMWAPDASRTPAGPMSVAAFFFSSGWDNGQVSQFAPHCVYFASRGMVTLAFEYRVAAKHRTGPHETMADVRSALRWIRMNAVDMGINPGKIAVIGGSAGAHAACAACMLDGTYDEPGEDTSILPAPNALVLFNPILDTSKKGFGMDRFRSPAEAKTANLIRAIAPGLPPTLIMHGTADRVVPFDGSYEFARKSSRKKNYCKLIEFEGQGHGFFNFNLSFEMYENTLMAIDQFLVELGFIDPDPNAGLGEEGVVV